VKKLVQGLAKKFNFAPQKGRGQNFLIDANIIKKIVSALKNFSTSNIVEIGAGFGFLTKKALDCGYAVTAVEIEEALAEYLKHQLADYPNFKLIIGDFLKMSLSEQPPFIVLGNIPYSISSPIIQKLCTSSSLLQGAVVMLQREFGEKLLLIKNQFVQSRLGLLVNIYFKARELFRVKSSSFWPKPSVDSIVLEFKKQKNSFDPEIIKKISFICFRYRRKTLWNNIRGHSEAEYLLACFKTLGITPTTRADSVPIQIWKEFFKIISERSFTR
jgi:16S rRNA (adenine1518-N6/adenine1519-N6)-dimethyltransferase